MVTLFSFFIRDSKIVVVKYFRTGSRQYLGSQIQGISGACKVNCVNSPPVKVAASALQT
ncbi:hypothetical protein SAMN05660420_03008 [Desulfuromusa kysingii]|uniref:Uncharacterized protein n=1 Tax=Desulfuromusa kysingii TaxID=37625 RepID=A0A1H4DK19_9BACT|nr:hypothetical protein SAMN05660420_03008 [Desulfuromusa kysingii]